MQVVLARGQVQGRLVRFGCLVHRHDAPRNGCVWMEGIDLRGYRAEIYLFEKHARVLEVQGQAPACHRDLCLACRICAAPRMRPKAGSHETARHCPIPRTHLQCKRIERALRVPFRLVCHMFAAASGMYAPCFRLISYQPAFKTMTSSRQSLSCTMRSTRRRFFRMQISVT